MPLRQAIEDTKRLTDALVEQKDVNEAITDQLDRASEIILNAIAIAAPAIQQIRAPARQTFRAPDEIRGPSRTTNDANAPGIITTSQRQTAGILAAIGKLQTSIDKATSGALFTIRNG